MPLPNDERLLTLVGRSDDELWAVGGWSAPTMLRWDGSAWSPVDVSPFCATQPLNGVWTAPGEDVWIAGFFSAMGRFDGDEWLCGEPPLGGPDFHAVTRAGGRTWWVGGNLFERGGNHGAIGRHGTGATALSIVDCP